MAKAHTQEAQLRQAEEEESARRNERWDQGRKCEQAEQADTGRHALSVAGVEPALGTQAPRRVGRPAGAPVPSAHGAPPDPRSLPQAPKVKLSDLPPGVWAEATLGRGRRRWKFLEGLELRDALGLWPGSPRGWGRVRWSFQRKAVCQLIH